MVARSIGEFPREEVFRLLRDISERVVFGPPMNGNEREYAAEIRNILARFPEPDQSEVSRS